MALALKVAGQGVHLAIGKSWLALLVFSATVFAEPCTRSLEFIGGSPRLQAFLSADFANRFSGEDPVSRRIEDLIRHAQWGGFNSRHITGADQIVQLGITFERKTLGIDIDYFLVAGGSLVRTAPSGTVMAKLLATLSRGVRARLADRREKFESIHITAKSVVNPQLKALLTSLGFRPATVAGRLAYTLNPWMYRTGKFGVDFDVKLKISEENSR